MPQADFAYAPAASAPGLALAASIFCDRDWLREEMVADVETAGIAVRECGSLADLLEGDPRPLGEMVLVDCPVVDGGVLPALARLDQRAARSGANVILSTTVTALDDIFACCDLSSPQILVDPSRGERVIAIGRVLARVPNLRLRDLSEDDRLCLLRLTEQVGQISERLEKMGQKGLSGMGGAFRFESPSDGYRAEEKKVRRSHEPRAPLPDPRLVRQMIRHRHARAQFFDGELFADPAWDILLDLTAARAEHTRVSVTSLCIAAGVPPTTALRWIGQMTEAGLLERVEDESDRRRAFIALSDIAADGMARYFAEVGQGAMALA